MGRAKMRPAPFARFWRAKCSASRLKRDRETAMADASTQGAPTNPGSVVNGIDVSHFQGSIDWEEVAAQGIGFAFVKATDGLGTDPAFATNWSGANQAGILRGAYHFFRPKLSAIDQAKHFCEVVESLGVRDLPPVL